MKKLLILCKVRVQTDVGQYEGLETGGKSRGLIFSVGGNVDTVDGA